MGSGSDAAGAVCLCAHLLTCVPERPAFLSSVGLRALGTASSGQGSLPSACGLLSLWIWLGLVRTKQPLLPARRCGFHELEATARPPSW